MPHRAFWGRGRYSLKGVDKGVDNKREQPILKNAEEVDPLGDGHAEELKEYLRRCWSWIVRCVMVGREWGVDVDLPMELLGTFISLNLLTWEDRERIISTDDWRQHFAREERGQ
jgi:hypothetical protein